MSHVLKWFPEGHYSLISLPGPNCPALNCISPKFILGTSSMFLHAVLSPTWKI